MVSDGFLSETIDISAQTAIHFSIRMERGHRAACLAATAAAQKIRFSQGHTLAWAFAARASALAGR
jgi:hypothetical protein